LRYENDGGNASKLADCLVANQQFIRHHCDLAAEALNSSEKADTPPSIEGKHALAGLFPRQYSRASNRSRTTWRLATAYDGQAHRRKLSQNDLVRSGYRLPSIIQPKVEVPILKSLPNSISHPGKLQVAT